MTEPSLSELRKLLRGLTWGDFIKPDPAKGFVAAAVKREGITFRPGYGRHFGRDAYAIFASSTLIVAVYYPPPDNLGPWLSMMLHPKRANERVAMWRVPLEDQIICEDATL